MIWRRFADGIDYGILSFGVARVEPAFRPASSGSRWVASGGSRTCCGRGAEAPLYPSSRLH